MAYDQHRADFAGKLILRLWKSRDWKFRFGVGCGDVVLGHLIINLGVLTI
jgi:hypothetical protein